MKSVLISIQPKWCELIASGKKTIEIRKTKPKLDTPFKCYIYCTKDKWQHLVQMPDKSYRIYNGKEYGKYDKSLIFSGEANCKVIGEFVCKKIDRIGKRGFDNNFDYCYLSLDVFGNDDIEIEITDIKKSCILKKELNLYGEKANCLYAWHISDLVIYDKPRELGEFYNYDPIYNNAFGWAFSEEEKRIYLKRPPQSWCYVEKLE